MRHRRCDSGNARPSVYPAHTSGGRPPCRTAVDRGLDVLQGCWCGGWQLLRATARDNANAVARDCRAAALRRGLAWHYLEVNEWDRGPGLHHRLWCVTRINEPPPFHDAIRAGARIKSAYPIAERETALGGAAKDGRYVGLATTDSTSDAEARVSRVVLCETEDSRPSRGLQQAKLF